MKKFGGAKTQAKAFTQDTAAHASEDTIFFLSEAYKRVRINLLGRLEGVDCPVLAVTSGESEAGKSQTCANLAISMAETGRRVLLIDANMRRPMQQRIFGGAGKAGLSTFLSSEDPEEKAVLQHTTVPSLSLLAAGPIPPNPSELLCTDSMRDLVDEARLHYDMILIDTPPVNVVADALALVSMVDAYVLVVRQNHSVWEDLERATRAITDLHAKVIGTVVNDVRQGEKPYHVKRYKPYMTEMKNK